MIDFNYTAPELLPFRIQEVLDAPNEPHRIGGVVYVPEGGGECDAILDESYYKGIHGYCECLKCSNCGEPLFSEFKSCPWCGKRIRKKVDE